MPRTISRLPLVLALLFCHCDRASDDFESPPGAPVPNAWVPDGFEATVWATDLSQPRGLTMAANGDLLVVERGASRLTLLFDDDGDGASGAGERLVLAEADGLNHGLAIHDGHLYASSAERVYRWPFQAGDRVALPAAERVVDGIPGGGHSTRTLIFDAQGRLYVSVGSAGNVDGNSQRSRIRRFTLPEPLGEPVDFERGEVFADGLRNEVGLAFDAQGRLWGVENGVDNLFRDDLGGEIVEDNPAEEVNLFVEPGRFYGYPYCWSEYRLPAGVGRGPNTQWAHEDFIEDGVHSDAWCRDPDNVVPPQLSMQAHSAPLDIVFYPGGSFPSTFDGDAFVSFHGSWNRETPTGYKVVRLQFEDGRPTASEPFFEYSGAGDIDDNWPHRPVGLQVGPAGELFVSSDRSDVLFRIGYRQATP